VKTDLFRVGRITYSNALPIYYLFDSKRFAGRAEVISDVPAKLNAALAQGELHLSPISSFSYAEFAEQYMLLPDLSVSAFRQVRSIYLFSKQPIEQLDQALIALTNTSATSVNLLKIILQKFLQISAFYQVEQPNLTMMLKTADAALLIGDDAIVAKQTCKGYHVYDLAELWYRFTGYPMTFAVWAVRTSAIAGNEQLISELQEAFVESKLRSLRHMSEMASYAVAHYGGKSNDWFTYFQGLEYDFTPRHIAGLEYYFAAAAELGLLPEPVKVKQWNGFMDTEKYVKRN
jgi:chorismate dehydratase